MNYPKPKPKPKGPKKPKRLALLWADFRAAGLSAVVNNLYAIRGERCEHAAP